MTVYLTFMNELRRRDLSWRDDANCIGFDTEMFYPGPSPSLEKVAKKICSQCAVIDYCLNDAIKRGDSHGILGGLTGRERKREAKRRENQAKSQARRNSYDQL